MKVQLTMEEGDAIKLMQLLKDRARMLSEDFDSIDEGELEWAADEQALLKRLLETELWTQKV